MTKMERLMKIKEGSIEEFIEYIKERVNKGLGSEEAIEATNRRLDLVVKKFDELSEVKKQNELLKEKIKQKQRIDDLVVKIKFRISSQEKLNV